jgi:hypothetical protein
MRSVFAPIVAAFLVFASVPLVASGPSDSATDAITLHQGIVVATTAQGLYRWNGTEWTLWHPLSLRGLSRGAIRPQVSEERLERVRAFDEVFEELVPSYGESAAVIAAADLLGYDRPKPQLRFEGLQEAAEPLHRAVLATASHRGWFWACTIDGMYRIGATVHRLRQLGGACFDLVAGGGGLVAATERGYFKLLSPGDWQRLSGPLSGAFVGLAQRAGRVFAATGGGIYELADRPIRRSGVVAEAFGRLGEQLVVLRDAKVSFLDEQGQIRPTGKRVAGAVLRAGDGKFLVTTEELWRADQDGLAWVPIRPTDGELRGALDYGGLWLATSSGVVLPQRLAEDQLLARMGDVLSPQRAVSFSSQLQGAMNRRGLELPNINPAWSRWLPKVAFVFDSGARRGVGVRDLEALADTLDIDPADIDLDLVDAEREWRNDLVDASWRAQVQLSWRPASDQVASKRTQIDSLRRGLLGERRRVSRRASRMLAGFLAAERRLILHPPRSVRSAAHRLLKIRTKRALLEGLLDEEIP